MFQSLQTKHCTHTLGRQVDMMKVQYLIDTRTLTHVCTDVFFPGEKGAKISKPFLPGNLQRPKLVDRCLDRESQGHNRYKVFYRGSHRAIALNPEHCFPAAR